MIDNIPLLAIQGYRLDGINNLQALTVEQLGYSREACHGKTSLI